MILNSSMRRTCTRRTTHGHRGGELTGKQHVAHTDRSLANRFTARNHDTRRGRAGPRPPARRALAFLSFSEGGGGLRSGAIRALPILGLPVDSSSAGRSTAIFRAPFAISSLGCEARRAETGERAYVRMRDLLQACATARAQVQEHQIRCVHQVGTAQGQRRPGCARLTKIIMPSSCRPSSNLVDFFRDMLAPSS